jgi:hypothetical protein
MKPKVNRTKPVKPGKKDIKIPGNKTLKTGNAPDWFKKLNDAK